MKNAASDININSLQSEMTETPALSSEATPPRGSMGGEVRSQAPVEGVHSSRQDPVEGQRGGE